MVANKKNIVDLIKYTISIIGLIYLIYVIFFDGSDKIGNIQVYSSDVGEMNWEDANFACKNLGEAWRLPTLC